MIATSVGVERSPSDTISVVAQAGAWTASVAIIAQLVAHERDGRARGQPEPRRRERRRGRGEARAGRDQPPRCEPGDAADEVASDDPGGAPALAPSVEREQERRRPEAREDERLAGGPRDRTEDGEEEPGVQTGSRRRRRIARRSWVSPQSTGGSVRAIDRDTRTRTPNYARAGRGDMFATLPDALRLFVVPVFAWAALQDVRTRRLPNRLWPPLYAFGALLLIWELAAIWPLAGFEEVRFAVRAAISLLFVAPLGYAFWYLGAFGGADARALIAIAILFPTFPEYAVAGLILPLVDTQLGVFSLTVLTNTVLLALAYPLGLAVSNLLRGERSATMFFARPVATDSLPDRHGRLFEDDAGTTRNGLARSGRAPDVPALAWGDARGPARESRPLPRPRQRRRDARPDRRRHARRTADGRGTVTGVDGEGGADRPGDDPWAAERFLRRSITARTAPTPRRFGGLAVVARKDRVLVSPGMPFVVPMAIGLVVSLTFGGALFAVLGAVGLV